MAHPVLIKDEQGLQEHLALDGPVNMQAQLSGWVADELRHHAPDDAEHLRYWAMVSLCDEDYPAVYVIVTRDPEFAGSHFKPEWARAEVPWPPGEGHVRYAARECLHTIGLGPPP